MNSKEMVKIAYEALSDKKGQDIKIIDIQSVSVLADYFIIADGSNPNQVQAMADRFPGGVLVFDAANRTAVKMLAKTWLRSAKIQDVGAYFAVSDAKSEISPWDSRLQVTSRGYMLGYNDLRDPSVSGLFRFLARTGDRIMKMQIVRICFGQR